MSISWFWLRSIFLLVGVSLNFLLTHLKFYIGQKEDLSFQTQPWLIRSFWDKKWESSAHGLPRINYCCCLMAQSRRLLTPLTVFPIIFLQLVSFVARDSSASWWLLPPTNDMERSYFQITTILLPSLCSEYSLGFSQTSVFWQLSLNELLWLTKERGKEVGTHCN